MPNICSTRAFLCARLAASGRLTPAPPFPCLPPQLVRCVRTLWKWDTTCYLLEGLGKCVTESRLVCFVSCSTTPPPLSKLRKSTELIWSLRPL